MVLAWTTEDELSLIRRLAIKDRAGFRKYAEGIVHRKHWGNLDKDLIISSTENTLQELTQT